MLELSERHHVQRHYRHHYASYLIAAILSVLLSAWINWREVVINPDAICYLLSAQAMTENGFKAGMQFCPQAAWPFYSLLVSGVAQVTHLSYQLAAYALDGLFTTITVVTFIAIIDTLGASKRILWLAAAVILLSHEFNYVRQYIVRDHGFWAFYLLSLFFMLRYFCDGAQKWAFAWSASIAVATLFRIEGAMFMLTLPLASFFLPQQTWGERFKTFFILNAMTIAIAALVIAWLVAHPAATMSKLGRTHEIIDQIQSGIGIMFERYQAMRVAIVQHVLTMEAARDASLVLVLMLLAWYLLNVIGNLSWIYSALVAYAWFNRAAAFARPAFVVLVAYLLVNLLVTFCFFAEHLFLAKRYLIAFTMTLMIWVPYALDRLIEQHTRQRRLIYIVAVLMLGSAIGGLFNFGYSKVYLRQAGSWLAMHVPKEAKLYVNDPQLMYYSEHNRDVFFNVIKDHVNLQVGLADGKWKQYDYIALRLAHHPDEKILNVMRTVPLTSVTEFANKRGDKVIIYKVARAEEKIK